jgi:hypothetical protein
MLTAFSDWYASSQAPAVAGFRGFLRRHLMLRRAAQMVLATARIVASGARTLSGFRRAILDRLWPERLRLRAVMAARSTGGRISVAGLVRMLDAMPRRARVLCIGGPLEIEQVGIVARCMRAVVTGAAPTASGAHSDAARRQMFDIVILVPPSAAAQEISDLRRQFAGWPRLICFDAGELEPQAAAITLPSPRTDAEPTRIVLLNDGGFHGGAGVAAKRQAASFLLNGWNVAILAWSLKGTNDKLAVTGRRDLDGRVGLHTERRAHWTQGLTPRQIAEALTEKVVSLHPDAVIVENIHGAEWPIEIVACLRQAGLRVSVYMHDCYWVTGRCAYAGSCTLFRSGCDASCPTPNEYPALPPSLIAEAWRLRGDAFTAPQAVPLIANSNWTRDFAVQRFGAGAHTAVIHLGLDHRLFAPIDKAAARKLLGLPQDKTIVLMGAVNLAERRKGGSLFRSLCERLSDDDGVVTVLFGRSSGHHRARSLGTVEDERLMPFIYSAADIFVSTAVEEAFGQTLLEASACGVPVVALNVGGVRDVVRHGETGLLVDDLSSADLLVSVEKLIADPQLRDRLGRGGRARVEQAFTLEHQARAWSAYFDREREDQRRSANASTHR